MSHTAHRQQPNAVLMWALLMGLSILFPWSSAIQAEDTVVIDTPAAEAAVLDPAYWNIPICESNQEALDKQKGVKDRRTNEYGLLYFDAVRSLLVRFPGAAEAVMQKLKEGHAVSKAELLLKWKHTEGKHPQRGRSGWGSEKAYTEMPGEWHAEAYLLKRPWSSASPDLAPTFDAYLPNGYWNRGGARSVEDRFPARFGPAPLHHKAAEAAIDITACLTDNAYGDTFAQRLRAVADNGFQIHKQELYDLKYNSQDNAGGWFDFYSWRPGTGYMRIWLAEKPVLRLTLTKAKTQPEAGALPPPADLKSIAAGLKDAPQGRSCMAPPDNWAELIKQRKTKPATMPDWMWNRINELYKLNGGQLGRFDIDPILSGDVNAYQDEIRKSILVIEPRRWDGHLTSDKALVPNAFGDILPAAAKDHLRLYWTAWLHPETEDVEHPIKRSYFRHYSWTLGTQNFNCNATAGCYLGGQFIHSENALRDARMGLENLLLRCWAFYNGANQEIGDTYYQALSNAGIHMIGKYADTPIDALMGKIASDRLTEQLASMYNPNLRRMTHPMGRGEMKYQCAFQDGPYFIMHSLSEKGALTDVDAGFRAKRFNVPLFGHEGPPARMALLAPWGNEEWPAIVDDKPLPWEVKARWWHLEADEHPSEWHVNYLAKHYSIASRSEDGQPVTNLTAQWRRAPSTPARMEENSTLQLSFGNNGFFFQSIGAYGMLHHRNKVIALKALPKRGWMKSPPNPDYAGGWRAENKEMQSGVYNAVHASAAIIAFGDVSQREVWVNGEKIDSLSGFGPDPKDPANDHRRDEKYAWEKHLKTDGTNSLFVKDGSRILIKDGVTYIALLPMSVNTTTRDKEVEIAYQWPVLYVHNFIYRSDTGMDLESWYKAEKRATSGFAIEMGDESEYGSFEKFREHIESTKLSCQWNDEKKLADVSYASGDDKLEMGFYPHDQDEEAHFLGQHHPAYRRVNGEDPYLPEHIDRESPWSVQGRTGRLEKNGAVLESEKGYRMYLLQEPKTGTTTAYNPVPDPIYMRVHTPEGVVLRADGQLGLSRFWMRPSENRYILDYAVKDEHAARLDLATALLFTNTEKKPNVLLNDRAVPVVKTTYQGKDAYAVALTDDGVMPETGLRVEKAEERWAKIAASNADNTYFRDWHVVGPFPNGGYSGRLFQSRDFGPEKQVNLKAAYTGIVLGEADENGNRPHKEGEVTWRPALTEEAPALSGSPLFLKDLFNPGRGVIAYAYTVLISDEDRRIQLLTGSDERIAVWVNGERVVFNRGYRMCYRDQDRNYIELKKGRNPVLVKLGHGHEAWRLYFRIADLYGLPVQGVQYEGAVHGLTPAGGK